MKKYSSDGRIKFFIAAFVLLFTLVIVVQADAKQTCLKTELRKNGISMKIVRLDRTDGFLFGLAFKGQQKQSVVIAPGLDRMILVLAGAHELILKADGTGSLQIVQTSDPLTLYVLCLVEAFTALLIDWKTCTEDDWACQGLLIVQMITDMLNCPETISQ